tara:strand:- start:838 stop:1164 length:327 start_codon:yes stop_codon:yes gene_type:complete
MRKSAGYRTRAYALTGALILAAAPAMAATGGADGSGADLNRNQAAELCTRLSAQFNNLKPFKEGLPYWQKANAAFTSGKADCAGDKPVQGAEAMRQAVSDLYVKPDTL